MVTSRGWLVFGCGIGLWVVARLVGSPTIHVVAVGLAVLPFLALAVSRRVQSRIEVSRRLSDVRVPPGRRVSAELGIQNTAGSSTSLLLLEDRVPPPLGSSARLVLPGIPAHNRQTVAYAFTPRRRGRFSIGPVTADVSDPFGLTRRRTQFDVHDELIVTPEIEDLGSPIGAAFSSATGVSRTRNLLRTGEEFYTMRAYQEGDDLRRIHWRSVARRGELMIRQDESSRRGTAVLFLDTRIAAVGESGDPCFERCASASASIGRLLCRSGFSLRFTTASTPLASVDEQRLLDTLASVGHEHGREIHRALTRLRVGASADATLVVVTAPPPPNELPALIRVGSAFGPKLAVLVYPQEPAILPAERAAQLEGRASQARLSLSRSGWDVRIMAPSMHLKDVWTTNLDRATIASASSHS